MVTFYQSEFLVVDILFAIVSCHSSTCGISIDANTLKSVQDVIAVAIFVLVVQVVVLDEHTFNESAFSV
jgi:uncharacterized membrane protein